jgi:hypothetical protein
MNLSDQAFRRFLKMQGYEYGQCIHLALHNIPATQIMTSNVTGVRSPAVIT